MIAVCALPLILTVAAAAKSGTNRVAGAEAPISAAPEVKALNVTSPVRSKASARHDSSLPEPQLLAMKAADAEEPSPRTVERDNGGPNIRATGVPPGFEEWQEPQTTLVDLYYGGRFLLSTMAEYTLETITFLAPGKIVERIPQLRDTALVAGKLASPLPTNTDRVCVRTNQPLCGRLEPDDLGVIFDETRFRVDLFLHRDMLARPEESPQYLPPPDHDRTTLVQGLSALHSGNSRGEDRYSLFGRSRLGAGSQHGFANWVSTDEQDFSVDEAGYRNDFQDHRLTVGLFEPRTDVLRAMPRQPLLGAGFARSLDTRMDLDSVISSPIELYLPSRSRVEIFRDGRLISSSFYEAGNQLIDTDRLPAGSYNVDIVITDSSGEVRVEQQFFVKSPLLAPPGEPLWFVEAGRVRSRARLDTFPQDLDTDLLRGGYRWRQSRWLGLGVAGASTGSHNLGELSANLQLNRVEAGTEIYASDDGGWGYGLRGVSRWGQYTASINAQRTYVDREQVDIDTLESPRKFQLLPHEQTFYSAQLSRGVGRGQAVLRVTERRLIDGARQRSTNLQYNHVLPIGAHQSLQLRFEIGEVEGDFRGQFALRWRNRRTRWQDSAQVAAIESDLPDEASGVAAGAGTRWRDEDLLASDVEVGARVDREPGGWRSATLDAEHRSRYGHGRGTLNAVDNRNQPHGTQFFSTLGYDTSLVVGEGPALGGPSPGESAVVLDLGEAPESRLDVMVNGRRQVTTEGGGRVVLTLPPYEVYRVSLIDSGTNLVRFDPAPRQFPLYPGNVVTREWALTPVRVLVGRLLYREEVCAPTRPCREVEKPLAHARLQGGEGFAATDGDGYFQAEVSGRVQVLRSRVNGKPCKIDLADVPVRDGVMRASRLLCERVDH